MADALGHLDIAHPPALPPAIEALLTQARLPSTYRRTLDVIAGRCRVAGDGSLLGCEGGPALEQAVGSRSRLMRHVARLEREGLLACVIRGGTGNGQANVYAIPAVPFGLAAIQIERDQRRMVPCADGRWRPIPASAPVLFYPADLEPATEAAGVSVCGKSSHPQPPESDTRSGKSDTRSPPQSEARSAARSTARLTFPGGKSPPLPPHENLSEKTHEALRDFRDEELYRLELLQARFDRIAAAGLLPGGASEHNRLQFVGAALYVRSRERLAPPARINRPAAYFARMIRRGEYLFGETYIEQANEWIKRGTIGPAVTASLCIDESPVVPAATGAAGFSIARSLYARALQSGSDAMTAKRAVLAVMRRREPGVDWTMEKLEQEIQG